ncbi:MAG TPA: hypothetical protein VGK88_00075 [bacterium]|jgi:hypothetical protein
MTTNTVPIGEAVRYGWEKVKERLGFWIVLELIVVLINGVPSWLGTVLQRNNALALATVVNLIGAVISIIVAIGVFVIAFKIYDGQQPTYADLFSRRNLFWRYLGGVLLYGSIVTVGFVLFIIPGFIFLLTYQFVPYLIVDRGLGATEALRISGRITAGAKWGLLGFAIVLFLINLLGVIALGVGLAITVPLTWMAGVYMYRYRLAQAGTAPAAPQPVPAI